MASPFPKVEAADPWGDITLTPKAWLREGDLVRRTAAVRLVEEVGPEGKGLTPKMLLVHGKVYRLITEEPDSGTP